MIASFRNLQQRTTFDSVIATLQHIGYRGGLLEPEWSFRDWFTPGEPKRTISAAVFGRTPATQHTAAMGVVLQDHKSGAALANANRALGAPLILEVADSRIDIWAVGAQESATQNIGKYSPDDFRRWVDAHIESLRPEEILRTKNLRETKSSVFQPSLFAGLIPELDERIAEILGPRLVSSFKAGWQAFKDRAKADPDESHLFQVAFGILAGKVFMDRQHPKFADLKHHSVTPEIVLSRVASYYGSTEPMESLLNAPAREAIFEKVWSKMDFQNLSVESLSQLWSSTLVTPETRKRLGIHRTRQSIVQYIIDRIPFDRFAPNERHVLEPCSGSSAFLIGAMDRMREMMPEMDLVSDRHSYFKQTLTGFEKDPFGVEISKLCLSLADYPNPNGWVIEHKDIFAFQDEFKASLAKARIVLCNPPFERISTSDVAKFNLASRHFPAELLKIVLQNIHPTGVLGFVLPQLFLDHSAYRDVRGMLASRYGHIEVVAHPDMGWETAAPNTVLLIATDPSPHSDTTLSCGVVRRHEWKEFDWKRTVPTREIIVASVSDVRQRIPVPELREVWEHLSSCLALEDVTVGIHKGVEWELSLESSWDSLVSDDKDAFPDSRIGVLPRTNTGTREEQYCQFEQPPLVYLNFAAEHQRRPESFARPWGRPKVIMSRGRASRGPWRTFAFADLRGIACNESFIGVWPVDSIDVRLLAAVINGPVANAFIFSHGDKPSASLSTIRKIPVPRFSPQQAAKINELVATYSRVVRKTPERAERILLEIDAAVLEAYRMPPRIERQLLDYFNGKTRNVSCNFGNYFPTTFTPCFSLSDWLTGRHQRVKASALIERAADIPEEYLRAMEWAATNGQETDE